MCSYKCNVSFPVHDRDHQNAEDTPCISSLFGCGSTVPLQLLGAMHDAHSGSLAGILVVTFPCHSVTLFWTLPTSCVSYTTSSLGVCCPIIKSNHSTALFTIQKCAQTPPLAAFPSSQHNIKTIYS